MSTSTSSFAHTNKFSVLDNLNDSKDCYSNFAEFSATKNEIGAACQQQPPDNKPSLPVDNVNLCFVGGVSTGKSTILNAIFCEELTQCKIKRTTMVPTVYVENENGAPGLDEPTYIFDTISKKNKDIIEKTESGDTVDDREYAELIFNVGKLDINILPDSYVNVYDIPGLNDARTKSVYYEYLQQNFFRFNLVVFIVDIHSGLNTSDEADMLHFIADHTSQQFTANNKVIYTLVVVNKADDMQLVNASDSELEITGELGEMFDQVQKTVTDAFRVRNVSDHLVGIIPLCAIDSYLYRMAQKHGTDFKLTPEQILKIGINEKGKRFSTLKPADQETQVREILNDQKFVDTMITLSGFGHFEKRLNTFLTQNDKGRQIRVDNLLHELRKYAPIQAYTAKHVEEPDLVAKLCEQHFRIFRAIEKIDKDIGCALIGTAMHDITDTIKTHIKDQIALFSSPGIRKVEYIVDEYDAFRDKVLTPYFAVYMGEQEFYPEFMTSLVVSKLCEILNMTQMVPWELNSAIDICRRVNVLTVATFERLNASIVGNVNRFSSFVHDFNDMKRDNDMCICYIETGNQLGVDMTVFLRFVILSRLCYKSYYSDKQLFQKYMIYKAYDEIPICTYLQNIAAKLTNPSLEWFLHGVNDAVLMEDAHQLDLHYLGSGRTH